MFAGVAVFVALLVWNVLAHRPAQSAPDPVRPVEAARAPATAATTNDERFTDEELKRAADELLTAVGPDRPENHYFTAFAKEHLRWMAGEYRAGRVELAFFFDTPTVSLPPDVLMAAWPHADKPTIFISKVALTKFLLQGGNARTPFTQQQKNDFALVLVHEILHLQNPIGDSRDPIDRAREESRVWREVNLQFVRPLRALHEPMDQRFLDVDDALIACRDTLPCPSLARLVRLGL